MEDTFKCPRCGFEQPETEICKKCRINIPKYIELQKRRTAAPDDRVQRPRKKQERRQDSGPSSEGVKRPPPESDKPKAETPQHREPPEPQEPPQSEIRRETGLAEGGLTGVGVLFEKTWEIFKRRIGTLIVLYLLSVCLVLIPTGLFMLFAYLIAQSLRVSSEALVMIGGIIGATGGLIAGCWGFGAFICAVADEQLSIRDSLEKGGQKIWSFIWLFSILGYIIPGGYLLFFIPGILFMVWFAFAIFILANENERGMDAVLKSKEYVGGRWVDVFGRLFLIWLVSVGVGMIPFIGSILSILFVPFEMIFVYLIYEDLRSLKGDVSRQFSFGEKLGWIGLATLGYFIVIVFVIAVMGAALMHSINVFQEAVPYQIKL